MGNTTSSGAKGFVKISEKGAKAPSRPAPPMHSKPELIASFQLGRLNDSLLGGAGAAGRGGSRRTPYEFTAEDDVYCSFLHDGVNRETMSRRGYKVHIAVDLNDLEDAWNEIISPVLIEHDVRQFKVLLPGRADVVPVEQRGKEVVIYLDNDAKTPAQWSEILTEIDTRLQARHIRRPRDAAGAEIVPRHRFEIDGESYYGGAEAAVPGAHYCFYTNDNSPGAFVHGRPVAPGIAPGPFAPDRIAVGVVPRSAQPAAEGGGAHAPEAMGGVGHSETPGDVKKSSRPFFARGGKGGGYAAIKGSSSEEGGGKPGPSSE